MEMGRGGACVPAVSPHKGASIVKFPMHNACILGMETPLCRRSGGHTGAASTVSFGQIACGTVDVVWVNYARGRLVAFGWIACKWLFCLCGMRGKI